MTAEHGLRDAAAGGRHFARCGFLRVALVVDVGVLQAVQRGQRVLADCMVISPLTKPASKMNNPTVSAAPASQPSQ